MRTAFKAAVYAELRQDSVTALQFYRAAFQTLSDLPSLVQDPRRLQRWYERMAVAELLQARCCTLLLLTGAVSEATAHLHRHLAYARRLPLSFPAVARIVMWGFVQRQLTSFAALLAAPPFSLREQPAALYAAAANADLRRRLEWSGYSEAREGAQPPQTPLAAGLHVGTWRREPPSAGPLRDDELEAWLVRAEEPAEYAHRNLELLTSAHTLLKSSESGRHRRLLCTLLSHMADEHCTSGDPTSAIRLLESACTTHRADGWTMLLSDTLLALRDCAGRLSLTAEHRAWSLELGVQPRDQETGAADRQSALLSAALAALDVGDAEAPAVPVSASVALHCLGFAEASVVAGEALHLHAALRFRPDVRLQLQSAAVELELGDGTTLLLELPCSRISADGWSLHSAHLAPPLGVVAARALVLCAGSHAVFRCSLTGEASAGEAGSFPELFAPSDPLAPAAMHVARLGGLPGTLRSLVAPPQPSAAMSLELGKGPLLTGQLVPLTITLQTLDDPLQSPALRLQFGGLPLTVLVPLSDGSHRELEADGACAEWSLPNVQPRSSLALRLLLRPDDDAPPQQLTVSLSCGGGASSCEAGALLPASRPPFVIAQAFTGPAQQHSLLPAGSARLALPLGEPSVLAATLHARGALVVHAVEALASEQWIAEVCGPGCLSARRQALPNPPPSPSTSPQGRLSSSRMMHSRSSSPSPRRRRRCDPSAGPGRVTSLLTLFLPGELLALRAGRHLGSCGTAG